MSRATNKPRSAGRAGLLVMAALVCLAIGRVVEHAYVAAIAGLAMLVIGIAWPWLATRLISATVRCPLRRCRMGEAVELNVTVRNGGWLPLPSVGIGIDGPRGLSVDGPPETCRPGETERSLHAVAGRRGVVGLASLRLETRFPFGLWRATRPVRSTERLVIWPVAARVDPSVLTGQSRVVSAHRINACVAADGELAGVRAYRRGDAVRSIHWQQTARHDRMIVRERAGGEHRSCTAILDTRRAVYPDEASFERAVSLMAGIVEQAAADGLSLAMVIDNARSDVSDDAGRTRAMDALAAIAWNDHADTVALRGETRGIFVTTSIGWASAATAGLVPLLVDLHAVPSDAGGGE